MYDIERRYLTGELIPASDFRNEDGGLETFGKIVWPDFKKGESVGQYSLDGDIYHRRIHPVEIPLEPEVEHLLRPVETPCRDNFERVQRPAGW